MLIESRMCVCVCVCVCMYVCMYVCMLCMYVSQGGCVWWWDQGRGALFSFASTGFGTIECYPGREQVQVCDWSSSR